MTEKIGILTDSTCDLEAGVIGRYGIEVLPLKIIYGDQVHLDRVDITPDQVYERLPEEVPTTSTPSPHEALAALRSLSARGFTHVLAVHLSSGLSGTFNTVRLVADQCHQLKTAVIDSKSLSMGLGVVVEQAARWIEEKVDFDSLIAKTQSMIQRTKGFYVLKTLDYLRRGGRINTVQAAVASILDLKPIISINEEGKYYSYKQVRGRRQSINELFEIARRAVESGRSKIAVVHGGAVEEARDLLERIKKLPGVVEVTFGQISPAMVVHTGPGLVGIVTSSA